MHEQTYAYVTVFSFFEKAVEDTIHFLHLLFPLSSILVYQAGRGHITECACPIVLPCVDIM